MWYTFICEDNPDNLKQRQQTRPKNIERLQQLKQEGRLLVAGPFPAIDAEEPGEAGFTGSLIIAEFHSLSEAQQWADDEPYLAAGVYSQVIVKPFKKALP